MSIVLSERSSFVERVLGIPYFRDWFLAFLMSMSEHAITSTSLICERFARY